MGTMSPMGIILILIAVGAGAYYRSVKETGRWFDGSLLLSVVATLVFAWFLVIGLILFFGDLPTNAFFADLQRGAIRAIGAGLVLFGMFGLLLARGLAVLISIEHAVKSTASDAKRSVASASR